MKKFIPVLMIVSMIVSFAFAQDPSMLIYNGELSSDYYSWTWNFVQEPESVAEMGYTPGNSALRWSTYTQDGWQGIFLGRNESNVDLSSIWSTDSVYFKLRAPLGLNAEDANLKVVLYDSRNGDWSNCVYYELTNFHDLDDGNWHQFAIALSEFIDHPDVSGDPIDPTDIHALSFEYFYTGVASEFYIDKVWIGNPVVSVNMVIFNGQSLSDNLGFYAWGFNNNDLTISEGEGYTPGTHAIVWESSNWSWQGMEFWCDLNNAGVYLLQDYSTCWDSDSLRIKINAPAGINNLSLRFIDWNDYSATKILDDVEWDGEWQLLNIPLNSFTLDEGFDISTVYWLKIEAAEENLTIPERVLITDIWTGDPSVNVDFIAPPAPSYINTDISAPYFNLIAPENIDTESGETYNIYYSRNLITDLGNENVLVLAMNVPEGEVATHWIYYPLEDGGVSYYYAVTCTDAAGNTSETFFASESSYTNTGKARAVVNYGEPDGFLLDGYFEDWDGIMPFNVDPANNPVVEGEITDYLDYSLDCYLAIDNDFLYIGFDVYDDLYTWSETNTVDWWNDESIEFFIGFYEIMGAVSHHSGWQRGAEPDYRIVFRPDTMQIDAWPNEAYFEAGSDNYYFESGGPSDYYIEAKIPLTAFAALGDDSLFVPEEGIAIPFEIQATDADIQNTESVARIQFGNNSTDNPWHSNPDIWTFTWIGMPAYLSVEDENPDMISEYRLKNNYPNPFNPSTTIEYVIPKAGLVELTIYNSLGQKVKTLVNKRQPAGSYTLNYNASDLASGVYFYKIKTKNFTQAKKMLLIK